MFVVAMAVAAAIADNVAIGTLSLRRHRSVGEQPQAPANKSPRIQKGVS